MRTAKFRYVEMKTMGEDDIVFAEFPHALRVDISIAKEIVACRKAFTDHKPHYAIIDMSNVDHVDKDARDFMRQPEGGLKNILATAFLASNPVAALIANFYIKAPKNFPARFFYSKQDALDWLLAYRASQSKIG